MEYHKSVLVSEVLEYLSIKPDKWYLDGTLGDGGHSLKILHLGGKVIGIDQDPKAIERTKKRFEEALIDRKNFRLEEGNFSNLDQLIGDKKLAGAVFDLGVSSMQFDDGVRGFSFGTEAELDMRMNPNLAVKAADLINGLNEGELAQLFVRFGEEPEYLAKKIAKAIALHKPITKTTELSQIVMGVKGRGEGIHPATLVFQALRIAVNDELNSLKEVLPKVLNYLSPGGRVVVISFHSLEDRIVKQQFKSWEEQGLGKILTDKPIVPTETEVEGNRRARSAKLRAFEKI